MNLKEKIREIENFPQEGISFKDITTLLKDGESFRYTIDKFVEELEDIEFDLIVGPESRGFIVGTPLSYATKKGFVPVRKPGKLPGETVKYEYDLEYGSDSLEIHKDAIQKGQKVVIADDLLATGGTLLSTIKLIEELGGEVVGVLCLIELCHLNGRKRLSDYNVKSLIQY
ncbi:MAG: adenine phosphoribosyltransferase [Anaeromicrobium sp.]|jgi:adenine phosphoribosyltransferase|uniref:adenine phosphoribosyltransferase n=1 Tax=Anaeromicrobium sp. TaxID=1929132 RepID=UPI0025D56ADB|nr:adenine phosphoribosyltransferase [Anaeromicrobium sp.]MCT4595019.1 adenine phosphoribosyltransferase [Anaeromicrobium sp.]